MNLIFTTLYYILASSPSRKHQEVQESLRNLETQYDANLARLPLGALVAADGGAVEVDVLVDEDQEEGALDLGLAHLHLHVGDRHRGVAHNIRCGAF